MPRKWISTSEGDEWRRQFAGDLGTSRARFRMMAELLLKNADACLLNHMSMTVAMGLSSEYGIDHLDRVRSELAEERRRIERRGGFSIVVRKK
jgi:hypothetical protein